MKILLVSNLYGALARGGAEAVVAAEATALRAAGHEVAVVSGDPAAGIGTDAADSNGVRKIAYDPGNLCFYTDLAKHGPVYRLWWHYLDIFNVGSAARLERIVRAFQPDVVHTHNLMGLGFMIPSSLRRLKVRHVHTVHDVQLLDPSGLLPADKDFRPAPHQALYIAVMRMMMGSPSAVIFPSEFHKRLHLRSRFFRDSHRAVVRNPSVINKSEQVASAPKENVYLFAGQLEKHKGIFDLLDAWEAASFGATATLEIAGAGSQSLAVAERVANMPGVKMLGRLDASALSNAYARAKWLVLPSRVIENAPSSIMEAFAHGVPVIAAASGGIPEVVQPGKNGYLFPPGSIKALADILAQTTTISKEEYSAFSSAATSATAIAGSSIPEHLKALIAAYQAK